MLAAQADRGTPQQDQIRPLLGCLRERISIANNEHIIAIAAPHDVGTVAAIQRVIAITTAQAVIAHTTRKPICETITHQAVMAGAADRVFNL